MNNEDRILEILTAMQADISSLKSDVTSLKEGQVKLNDKLDTLVIDVEDIKLDIAVIQTVQNQHTNLLKKIARFVEAQTNESVSLDHRVTKLERLAGII